MLNARLMWRDSPHYSNWIMSLHRGENKKSLKPPPTVDKVHPLWNTMTPSSPPGTCSFILIAKRLVEETSFKTWIAVRVLLSLIQRNCFLLCPTQNEFFQNCPPECKFSVQPYLHFWISSKGTSAAQHFSDSKLATPDEVEPIPEYHQQHRASKRWHDDIVLASGVSNFFFWFFTNPSAKICARQIGWFFPKVGWTSSIF